MVESRWLRSIGPGLVAIAAVGLVASTTLGAGDRPWAPRACAGPPVTLAAAAGQPAPKTLAEVRAAPWYRVDPVLDGDGALRGQRLVSGLGGRRGGMPAGELARESFAAGPFGRIVLVGSDDGTASRLHAFDSGDDCAWLLATEAAVIRRATIDPAATSIYETRVDRASRADLGVWRRPLDGTGPARQVLPPLPVDDRFGRTFSTTLTWDAAGRRLAVQACGEVACRTRLLDPATGESLTMDDDRLGILIGLDDARLVSHGACRGLPCPIVTTTLATRASEVLVPNAGRGALLSTRDGPRLVHEVAGAPARGLRSVAVDGSAASDLGLLPDGLELVVPGAGDSGTTLPAAWVLLAPDGRLPADAAPSTLRLRHVPDGATVQFEEATR